MLMLCSNNNNNVVFWYNKIKWCNGKVNIITAFMHVSSKISSLNGLETEKNSNIFIW